MLENWYFPTLRQKTCVNYDLLQFFEMIIDFAFCMIKGIAREHNRINKIIPIGKPVGIFLRIPDRLLHRKISI